MYHQYTPERLEKKALEILQGYKGGQLLENAQAMDVDHFAEFYCDAVIDFAHLSENGQILGCSCFNDGVLFVWDEARTHEYPIEVKKGSIFVDKALLDCDIEGRIRFTIIHECSHLILHPRFMYQKPGSVVPKIDCAVFQVENWTRRTPMTDEDIREWQANRLGAALIMPAKTVRLLYRELSGSNTMSSHHGTMLAQITTEMAGIYKVSKAAMSNRLRDLDILT